MVAEGQSDRMASDTGVGMKQRCITEFLHVEKMAHADIRWHLVDIYGDQTVDVSTVRQWVVRFRSGDSDTKDKPHSKWPCTVVTSENEECLDQLIHTNQLIMVTMLKNSAL